jgi:hypothetical protein
VVAAPQRESTLKKPKAVALKDAEIQELHIRDFSVADTTVPAAERGTCLAFTDKNSDGSKHLRELDESGTSYVHLLPAFDIATIPEKKSEQSTTGCDLADHLINTLARCPDEDPVAEREWCWLEFTLYGSNMARTFDGATGAGEVMAPAPTWGDSRQGVRALQAAVFGRSTRVVPPAGRYCV